MRLNITDTILHLLRHLSTQYTVKSIISTKKNNDLFPSWELLIPRQMYTIVVLVFVNEKSQW